MLTLIPTVWRGRIIVNAISPCSAWFLSRIRWIQVCTHTHVEGSACAKHLEHISAEIDRVFTDSAMSFYHNKIVDSPHSRIVNVIARHSFTCFGVWFTNLELNVVYFFPSIFSYRCLNGWRIQALRHWLNQASSLGVQNSSHFIHLSFEFYLFPSYVLNSTRSFVWKYVSNSRDWNIL